MDALADCGRARALNPEFHKVLRRLSKIHEELRRPGQASELLQELKTLGGVTGADSAELSRMVMQLEAKRRMEGCPNHFRMLNVATTATVRPHPLVTSRSGDTYWMTLKRCSLAATALHVSNGQHACRFRS